MRRTYALVAAGLVSALGAAFVVTILVAGGGTDGSTSLITPEPTLFDGSETRPADDALCEGDDQEACEVLKYFIDLAEVKSRASAALEEELEYIAPTLAPGYSVDEYRAVAQEGIARTHPYFNTLIEGLEGLRPPLPLKSAHAAYLVGYKEILAAYDQAAVEMDGAETYEEVDFIFAGVTSDARETHRRPCQALEAIAARYNVRSGLQCPKELPQPPAGI